MIRQCVNKCVLPIIVCVCVCAAHNSVMSKSCVCVCVCVRHTYSHIQFKVAFFTRLFSTFYSLLSVALKAITAEGKEGGGGEVAWLAVGTLSGQNSFEPGSTGAVNALTDPQTFDTVDTATVIHTQSES